jgi:hypothetical protein
MEELEVPSLAVRCELLEVQHFPDFHRQPTQGR